MEYIFFGNAFLRGVNIPKSQVGFLKMCTLCDAAETLFDKKGFYDTSVVDICRLAKAAVGTFYIYFQDKSAIYNYLVRNYYVVIKKHLNKSIAHCRNRFEMEREGLKAFIRFGHIHPQCYKIIWGSSHIDPAIFEDYYIRFAKSYAAALERFGEELIDIDYSTAAWFLMGVSTFVCLKAVLDKERLSEKKLDVLVDEVMKLLSGGLFSTNKKASVKKSPRQKKVSVI